MTTCLRFALAACASLWALALVAAPAGLAGPCSGDDLPQRTLVLVNRLRAEGAVCGGNAAAPAPPMEWSDAAAAAARGHAQDMAQQGRMAHAGSDGQQAGQRLRRAGLEWQRWAENLAVGHRSIDHVIRHWTASTVHCENLMEPRLLQLGLACVPDRNGRIYWAMNLLKPRER